LLDHLIVFKQSICSKKFLNGCLPIALAARYAVTSIRLFPL